MKERVKEKEKEKVGKVEKEKVDPEKLEKVEKLWKLGRKIPRPLVDREWRGATAFITPIFPGPVMFFAGSVKDQIRYDEGNPDQARVVERLRNRPPDESVTEGETIFDGVFANMRIPVLDLSDEESVGALYHEALHVAWETLKRLGVEMGEHAEVLAYFQGYIVDSVLRELRAGNYGTLLPDGTRLYKPEREALEAMEDKESMESMESKR